jgi:parallel beta-helix repeat protein
LSFAAFGADGRIPIPGGTAAYAITAPGSYYLTGDLTVASGSYAIQVASNLVTLDLNGHTVSYTNGGAGNAIDAGGYASVRVTNGIVSGGYWGVGCFGSGTDVRVDHLTITGCVEGGINVAGPDAMHRVRARVENNVVALASSGPEYGIHGDYLDGAQIEGNTLQGGFQAVLGIFHSTSCSIARNIVTNGGNLGLLLRDSTSCAVLYNTVCGNPSVGIYLWYLDSPASFNQVSYNTCSKNAHGVYLDNASNNTVDWNECADNSGYGVYVSGTATIYDFNRCQNNTKANYYAAGGNTDGGHNL